MIDLKSREKKIITALAALVIVALIQVVFISPALKKRTDLNRRIIQARRQLAELRVLKEEYDQILVETEKINRKVSARPRSFTLFSFLDQTATKLNLKNNMASMKPSRRGIDSNLSEEMVEVRLEGISLENLVAYLYEIERTGAAVAIASIRIQPESRLGGGLNVSMQVTSVGPP
jgi:type II secretory pathway component PulM